MSSVSPAPCSCDSACVSRTRSSRMTGRSPGPGSRPNRSRLFASSIVYGNHPCLTPGIGLFQQSFHLLLHLAEGLFCSRVIDQILHLIGIGFEIVKLIHPFQLKIVNLFPAPVARRLVLHSFPSRDLAI